MFRRSLIIMYLIKYILMINKVFKLLNMSGKQIKLLLFVLFGASSYTKIINIYNYI